jgi:hypothetical protein
MDMGVYHGDRSGRRQRAEDATKARYIHCKFDFVVLGFKTTFCARRASNRQEDRERVLTEQGCKHFRPNV